VRPMPRCARSSASSACSGLTVAFCGARARIGMTCTTNEARRSACACALGICAACFPGVPSGGTNEGSYLPTYPE
jgi:hypothetical protein